MRWITVCCVLLTNLALASEPIRVGEFPADGSTRYIGGNQTVYPAVWPVHEEPTSPFSEAEAFGEAGPVAVTAVGKVYVGTTTGIWELVDARWKKLPGLPNFKEKDPLALAPMGDSLVVVTTSGTFRQTVNDWEKLGDGAPGPVTSIASGKMLLAGGPTGLFEFSGTWKPAAGIAEHVGKQPVVRQVGIAEDGRIAVAAEEGLFLNDNGWQTLLPAEGKRSWAPRDVRGVTFDRDGALWFASPQGVGRITKNETRLYTGDDGLPFDDFTTAATASDGAVWFGTKMGAIRFDGKDWSYRQGKRWLAGDEVRAIACGPDGTTWLTAPEGVAAIERRPVTLAQKAEFFEQRIDRFHRRTPYEYVLGVRLSQPGDLTQFTQHDSDNDGLWTSMYGAGECFAYAATKDPKARERATKAFEAVAFLSEVTQGGSHPAPYGFPARTILPTSGPDPNLLPHYSEVGDRRMNARDPLWKILQPRWPTSADGKWYWKTDTSSDELDGHYFLYALYYDLVAETEAEKQRARDVVARVTDHLLDHGLNLVDHDGTPTRWARFHPETLDTWPFVLGRGLNSLSVLSYLKTAVHVTGDAKYQKAYDALVKHGYAANATQAKWQTGVGTGNQSDDEMAMMCYYNLIQYETDPTLLRMYTLSLGFYWRLEAPEMNPLFNFIFAAKVPANPDVSVQSVQWFPLEKCLADGVETLRRYPLDRVRWEFRNSHRTDIVPVSTAPWVVRQPTGQRRNGKVVPVDERFVEHWNHSPWILDEGGDGRSLADGASFLLPYYLGLYHGFLVP